MLHYVHQLVTNCVCLLFGAEQVVYSGGFRAFSLITAACWKWCYRSSEGEPNSKVVGRTAQKLRRFITTNDLSLFSHCSFDVLLLLLLLQVQCLFGMDPLVGLRYCCMKLSRGLLIRTTSHSTLYFLGSSAIHLPSLKSSDERMSK